MRAWIKLVQLLQSSISVFVGGFLNEVILPEIELLRVRDSSVSRDEFVDRLGTQPYRSVHTSTKAQPAKAGAAKLRVLASSATRSIDATKGPTTAELPKVLLCRIPVE
jgi:hypothetical protein